MSFHQNRLGWARGGRSRRVQAGNPAGPRAGRAVISTFRRDFAVDLLQKQR
jgi:hypothetical protein